VRHSHLACLSVTRVPILARPCPLPTTMCLALPDELLLAMFELLPHVKPISQGRDVFAPLVFVCRQWNVSFSLCHLHRHVSSPPETQTIALPLLYRDVPVFLKSNNNNIQPLLASLSAAERRGQSLWPYIRAISLREEPYAAGATLPSATSSADALLIYNLLSRSCALSILRTHSTSANVADTYTRACAATLLRLEIYDLSPFSLAPVRQLTRLRSLHIVSQSCDPGMLPSGENAWMLADLEELRWDQRDTYYESNDPDTIKFLAACRFPRLQRASLCIEMDRDDEDDGPRLLNSFLRAHVVLESLDVVILPATYEVALASSTLSQLSLQRCGDVDPTVFICLPPTLRRMDLPVFGDTEKREHHNDVAAVLTALLRTPKHIQEVHLALGHRWGPVRRTRHETVFRLGGQVETLYSDQLDAIRERAVQLEALGITLYDEDGRTMADYNQER
jgi:hypothetical protein